MRRFAVGLTQPIVAAAFAAAVFVATIAATGAAAGEDGGTLVAAGSGPIRSAVEGKFPSLEGASGWLNSPPLTREGLQGKVVVIHFMTYTCINWLRTLPYVRAWASKYGDQGPVVIGVHTPEFEFEFEKGLDNVRMAMRAMRVEYPVAIDSDYAIWNAFDNQYWPALYFIDAKGDVRHRSFGEGDYERSERVIRQLLSEAGYSAAGAELVKPDAQGVEAAADWDDLRSPENYLRRAKTRGFVSPGSSASKSRSYSAPTALRVNQWGLAGTWTVMPDAVTLDNANGRIVYRFHARDLRMVMRPATRGSPVRFRVRVDGRPPGAAHGVDVDERGEGVIGEQRRYQLIRQSKPIADRQFEIQFLDPGVEAFAFTFG